jgi:hypothetical protein
LAIGGLLVVVAVVFGSLIAIGVGDESADPHNPVRCPANPAGQPSALGPAPATPRGCGRAVRPEGRRELCAHARTRVQRVDARERDEVGHDPSRADSLRLRARGLDRALRSRTRHVRTGTHLGLVPAGAFVGHGSFVDAPRAGAGPAQPHPPCRGALPRQDRAVGRGERGVRQ